MTDTTSERGKHRVLFVCTHNSARSQMAEGLLRSLAGERYEVQSAGTEPGRLHPDAVTVMKERGIDISGHRSKALSDFAGDSFDTVVTVCDGARESCPFFPGKRVLHRSFPDPSISRGDEGAVLDAFRDVRNRIEEWIRSYFLGRPENGGPDAVR